jgi:hypothetical protein
MNTSSSPYAGKSEEEWDRITRRILAKHPLDQDTILSVALTAWNHLWQTTIGSGDTAVPLLGVTVPATVVGYFFEILFGRELERRFPGVWRGGLGGGEKDLVHVPDPKLSVEIKTSGQSGYKIYGNRSYGQKVKDDRLAKKDKSGFYITANFVGTKLSLIRFGWIDASDWQPQKSPTGQMAGLPERVYRHKLVKLTGPYELEVPIGLLAGVGPKVAAAFEIVNIRTIRELLDYGEELPTKLARIRKMAVERYGN